MKKKPKFRTGQVVGLIYNNYHYLRVSKITPYGLGEDRNSYTYLYQGTQFAYTEEYFEEYLRPLTAKECGKRP